VGSHPELVGVEQFNPLGFAAVLRRVLQNLLLNKALIMRSRTRQLIAMAVLQTSFQAVVVRMNRPERTFHMVLSWQITVATSDAIFTVE
jgi:hypothetical protein